MSLEPKPTPEVHPALRWTRRWLVLAPPARRVQAGLVVFIILSVLGFLDYVAGFWVSLQFFYLIPIVLAVVWLGWRAGCLTAICGVGLRFAGDGAAGIFNYLTPLTVFWNRLAEAAIACIVALVVHALFSLQRELEERVRQRTASLEQAIAARNQLQTQLFDAGNRERSAIGHDLHDGLGQHLTATAIAANLLASRLAAAGQPTAADAQTIVRLLQEGIMKTRQIARGLLLSAIEPDAFAPELDELATNIAREHAIPCHFTLRGTLPDLNVATTSHLFYIAQEAARNAVRHAGATHVEIDLCIDERTVALSITDDGTGLPTCVDSSPGMGLRIMKHRSELIGARFHLDQPAAGGTVIRCELPL